MKTVHIVSHPDAGRSQAMKNAARDCLKRVQDAYSGPEADLWKLIMGEHIHIGGYESSMDLAERSGVGEGMQGVDLCCALGAGMRLLIRAHGVQSMRGVDATARMIEWGRALCAAEGMGDRTEFLLADVCESGLPSESADFVWGEDAWCYVFDKQRLIVEAARLVKPGGVVAFTDWIVGHAGLSKQESQRFCGFMKFPNVESLHGYRAMLMNQGCEIEAAQNTGRFPRYMDLYLNMLDMQLKGDALKILGFDMAAYEGLVHEMMFMRDLAHAGKIVQGIFVARKKKRE